jgi:predicted GNAT superfamily acetyltransferase
MGIFPKMTKNIYVYKRNFEFSNNHESEKKFKWFTEECSSIIYKDRWIHHEKNGIIMES